MLVQAQGTKSAQKAATPSRLAELFRLYSRRKGFFFIAHKVISILSLSHPFPLSFILPKR